MAASLALPVLSDTGLSRYLAEVHRFPMLAEEEEYMLAKAWTERQDMQAAHRLVTSHLRLVAKIAMGFRGYGLPVADLISEGNIGLMQAVKRFEPERGFRLATYAMWWIRASINEYVLRSWSLVKMGTSAAQKKLFFNLRRVRNRLLALEDRNLSPKEISQIARELEVPERDVMEMDQRLGTSDRSLNAHVGEEGEEEWMDFLADTGESQEVMFAEEEESAQRRALLADAMGTLNAREKRILEERWKETPATLEELSREYGVSRERVRQIEARAIEKLRASVRSEERVEA